MKLNTKQKNLLANRAFLLAKIDADIATSRSMDDEARVDGMLSWDKEFDKTDLYDAHEAWQKKYLSSAEQFGISKSFLAQLYNYAYDEAYTCEQDPNLVYNFDVAYSNMSKAIFAGIENPALVGDLSNEIPEQRKEGQRLKATSPYAIAKSLTTHFGMFLSYQADPTLQVQKQHLGLLNHK